MTPFEQLAGITLYGVIIADVMLHADGFALLLASQYVDVKYCAWRRIWDTTEEEDFILGNAS